MSRFVGDDYYDPQFDNEWELWQANFDRHVNGVKGQQALRDLRDALLALPDRKLISGRLADEHGCVCTVGALALHRRVLQGERPEDVLEHLAAMIPQDLVDYDSWECEERTARVGESIGLKRMMAVALAGKNDDWYADDKTPEQRFERVLRWVESKIKEPVAA